MQNIIAQKQDEILEELLFLFKKAVESTLRSRRYWGLGTSAIYKDLIFFTDEAVEKFGVQVTGIRREIDATDWYIDVKIVGSLEASFDALGLDSVYEVCVQSSEEERDVFSKLSDVVAHGPWHNFSSNQSISAKEYDDLLNNIMKFTLFLRISS